MKKEEGVEEKVETAWTEMGGVREKKKKTTKDEGCWGGCEAESWDRQKSKWEKGKREGEVLADIFTGQDKIVCLV